MKMLDKPPVREDRVTRLMEDFQMRGNGNGLTWEVFMKGGNLEPGL